MAKPSSRVPVKTWVEQSEFADPAEVGVLSADDPSVTQRAEVLASVEAERDGSGRTSAPSAGISGSRVQVAAWPCALEGPRS
jgi:hypothetical protein